MTFLPTVLLSRLKMLKFCVSHISHLSKAAELLSQTTGLESLSLVAGAHGAVK